MNHFVLRCLVVSMCSLAGCALLAPVTGSPPGQKLQQPPQQGTGKLRVDLSAFEPKIKITSRDTQALQVGTIAKARVTVTGDLIFDLLSTTVSASNGKATAEIANIPVGTNRILTVEGLDAAGAEVPGAILRAVVTIKQGANQASVTWASTLQGTVFDYLHKEDRRLGQALTSRVSADEVQGLISALTSSFAVPHPSLVKAGAIASRIRADGGQVPSTSSAFVTTPAYVELVIRGLPSGKTITTQVTDPASKVFVNVANGRYRIAPITPGSWVLLLGSAEFGQKSADLSLGEGASASVEVDYSGSEAIGIDFGEEATESAPQPDPLPTGSPAPVATPTPSPVPTATPVASASPSGEGFFNLLIRFDQ